MDEFEERIWYGLRRSWLIDAGGYLVPGFSTRLPMDLRFVIFFSVTADSLSSAIVE